MTTPCIKSLYATEWTECDQTKAIEYATHLFHSITTMEDQDLVEYIKQNRVKGIELTAEQLRANKQTDKRTIAKHEPKMVSLFDSPKPAQADPMQDPINRKILSTLAREQLKTKLLTDINIDLQICELEGWSKQEYLLELQNMINEITNNII